MFVLVAVSALTCQAAAADDSRLREGMSWRQGDWREKFWKGPCEVKIEYNRNEFRRNLKCEGGIMVVNPEDRPKIPPGASWRGQWKREFNDGPCVIKQEAEDDKFKEEVRCDRSKGG
jgi:hypothetical protein